MRRQLVRDFYRAPIVVRAFLVLAAVGLVLVIAKWVLITAAVLAVPFGAWWWWDRGQQRAAAAADEQRREREANPVDPHREAEIADDLGLPGSAAFWRAQPPAGSS